MVTQVPESSGGGGKESDCCVSSALNLLRCVTGSELADYCPDYSLSVNYIVHNTYFTRRSSCYMLYKIACYILSLAYKPDHINIFTYFMVLALQSH